jgi:hypothetical protein
MGPSALLVEQAIEHYKVTLAPEDQRLHEGAQFSVDTLQSCMDTHILVPIVPLSINEIQSAVGDELFWSQAKILRQKEPNKYSRLNPKDDFLYLREAFAFTKGRAQWLLVRREPVPHSGGLTWPQMLERLPSQEFVPSARVMVYTIILFYLVTGIRLFGEMSGCCLSLGYDKQPEHNDPEVERLAVGHFDASKIKNESLAIDRVLLKGGGYCSWNGLAAARVQA